MPFSDYLQRVCSRANLTADDAAAAMALILEGEASAIQIAAFLAALKTKGETPEEVLGFARAMRAKAARVDPGPLDEPLVDTCGTGGDASGTFNVSTVAAFVVAGAGVRVAKHGNRSTTGACGSADLMEALGVRIDVPPEAMGRAIREVGIGFLFAPAIHGAMRHAQPVRAELKMRTVFNLLGPLTNPAGATVQVAGAPALWAAELMAEALARLGLERGYVVHGSDGLDEITTTGATEALEIVHGAIAHRTLYPEDFGLPRAARSDLKGGGPAANADIAHRILAGERGPRRDIVLANASAALVAAGRAADFREGVRLAAESIDSGAARRKLEDLKAFTLPRNV
jgi:anthranilate phosphoribosyltransferase